MNILVNATSTARQHATCSFPVDSPGRDSGSSRLHRSHRKSLSHCLIAFGDTKRQKPIVCRVSRTLRGIVAATDMSEEQSLEFRNSKGERVSGLLTTGKDASNDVVVLCHGYTSNKNSCRFAEIAKSLATAGLSSFRFDHPCAVFGDSERFGDFRMGNHADEVDDIHCAIEYLRQQNFRVVCLLGHSKGGTNVIKYAADFGDVPLVINLAGRFKPMNGLEKRFGKSILERLQKEGPIEKKEPWGVWTMRYEDFIERATLPMEEYAKIIREAGKVNLLCIHGRDDATISYEESEHCASIAGAQCIIIETGDHNFTNNQSAEDMIRHVVAFASRSV